MPQEGIVSSRVLGAALLLAISPALAPAATVDSVLESGELAIAYNPVLLDYLLDEGAENLSEAQRSRALDQLVSALKRDIEITPEEQKTAALLAAGSAIAELFGNEYGDIAGDATYDIWKGWVNSAVTLQRAGYSAEAEAFFTKCIQIYPYSDLRGRCAIGLAAGRPDEAVSRLLELTESSDSGTINASLRLLGSLAGSEGFPAATRATVLSRLTEFTAGLKRASYGEAACEGLVRAADPGAVPTLQKLSAGMMNSAFFRCARRGLLLTFNDRSVVPLLEKAIGGGKFSTSEPGDRFFAARVLMEGGVESGYAWAMEEFAKGGAKPKGKMKGLMKKVTSTEKEADFKPALVNALVWIGGDRSRKALSDAMGLVEKGSWIETWIAIGLLELDDTSHIDLARLALGNPEWGFTAVRVATALARHDDYAGIAVLERLYQKAAQGLEPEAGRAALAFLGGEGDLYLADRGERKARLIRLRRQIADALATIDQPESARVLADILDDDEDSVRSAAAYALGRMSEPSAAAGLAKAIGKDYGTISSASRNPVVHAHVARRAASEHPGSREAQEVLAAAKASPFTSVQFLALCAE